MTIINSIVGPLSVEPGCNNIVLYSNIHNDDNLMLMIERESQEPPEQHIQSDEFRKTLEVMELASQAPDISFKTISESAEFELIERLRS